MVYKAGAPSTQTDFGDFNNCGETCHTRLEEIDYENMTVPHA